MVSVVIPMYNAADTILECLRSVAGQSYRNLEVIVVNDGSTDECGELVGNFMESCDFPVVLISQANSGVSAARNAGIKVASGEYIAFLDADDSWCQDKLKIQLDILKENKNIFFLGSAANGRELSWFFLRKMKFLQALPVWCMLMRCFVFTSGVIIKRDVLIKMEGFDESMCYAEDMDLWLRIVRSYPYFYINQSLAFCQNSMAGLSSNLKAMEKGELRNIAKARSLKLISGSVYFFLCGISMLKYGLRIINLKSVK